MLTIEKVKIIYLSTDLGKNKIVNSEVKMNNHNILFVGNIKPHKNLKRLVAAYKILHRKYKITLPLLIVGEIENFKLQI